MAKKSYLDDSESQPWNVAKSYAELKIMKWLYLADEYDILAEFGCANSEEDIQTDPKIKESTRINSLKRLIHALRLLISNGMFEVKKKQKDAERLEEFAKDLTAYEKIYPTTFRKVVNNQEGNYYFEVNEVPFNFLLKKLREIKQKINEPLNDAGLIFTNMDVGFDPDELKRKWDEDIGNSG